MTSLSFPQALRSSLRIFFIFTFPFHKPRKLWQLRRPFHHIKKGWYMTWSAYYIVRGQHVWKKHTGFFSPNWIKALDTWPSISKAS